MKINIENYTDSENRQSLSSSDYELAVEGDILTLTSRSIWTAGGKAIVLLSMPLQGCHNVDFSIKSVLNIHIEFDNLQEGQNITHFHMTFSQKMPYSKVEMESFCSLFKKIEKKNMEQNRRLHERITEKQEEKRKEEEAERELQIQQEAALNNEIHGMVSKASAMRQDRRLEKVFLNYFEKYVRNRLLSPELCKSLARELLHENMMYERVKDQFPVPEEVFCENNTSIKPNSLPELDKLLNFMNSTFSDLRGDSVKLLTWIELCETAAAYYTNCFCISRGSDIDGIEGLTLEEAVGEYINSYNMSDSEEMRNMFVYYLMSFDKFAEEDSVKGYGHCRYVFNNLYAGLKKSSEYNSFLSGILSDRPRSRNGYTIDDIDLMSGSEFERFVSEMFVKMGYRTRVTQATGDQGIDVVAEKNGVKYGIQAKCYSSSVSNSAIQEVVAGLSFYKCDKALVVTNNYYTRSAIELAKSNNVILWDRDMLKKKIEELF